LLNDLQTAIFFIVKRDIRKIDKIFKNPVG